MDLNGSCTEEFSDSFSQDDIINEYKKLLDKYKRLKTVSDEDQQKIYELRRNWETASSAEAYLSQELELITATQLVEIESVQQKCRGEVDDLKKKYSDVVSRNVQLEQKVDEIREENDVLQKKFEELEMSKPSEVVAVSSGSMEREFQLAKENLELLAKIDEERDKTTSSIMTIAERDRQIEILNEQLECMEENMNAKREEVDEKSQLLESAQERIIEMSTELAMLKMAPEDGNRKGNSLFAEVDDQRQEMKRILAAQKKHYLQMKKSYNESEQEIRRLKRENAAMYREMQVCATIFIKADKLYKERLNERILQLLRQNESLEKKLMWTQEKLIALSNDKGINWLDSMLTFCKTETEEIKEQLRSCRMQKGILEETLHKSEQELAKWRFEALKSRCVIINRETLLEENNIAFTPYANYKFELNEKDCPIAKPKILFENASETDDKQAATVDEKSPISHGSTDKSAKRPARVDIPSRTIETSLPSIDHSSFENDTTPVSSRIYDKNCSSQFSNSTERVDSDSSSTDLTITETLTKDVSNSSAWLKFQTEQIAIPRVKSFTKTPFKLKHNHELTDTSVVSQVLEISDEMSRGLSIENQQSFRSSCSANETDSNSNKEFEIYEDTICRLPVIAGNSSTTKQCENVSNSSEVFLNADCSPVLTENLLKPPQSILIRNRGIFDDVSDTKAVTFSPELTTEIKNGSENDLENSQNEKPKRKSNVLVKRIVVKSNFNQK